MKQNDMTPAADAQGVAAVAEEAADKVIQTMVMRTRFTYPDGETRKPRTGKIAAQTAHASMAFLSKKVRDLVSEQDSQGRGYLTLTDEEREWLCNGKFTKITLGVDTEEELMAVYEAAKAAGLTAHLIVDAGLTEFGGKPTPTGIGIGPHYKSKIDAVTGHLKLI